MTQPIRTIALIVAAGKSERLGSDIPKPYLTLSGTPVLRRTLETFLTHPRIDGVRTVIARAHHPLYRKLADGLMLFPCVIGGDTRQESVLRGLKSIAAREPERVLIHDAARPLVSHALIDRVLDALDEYPAVLPVLPVQDTLKSVENNAIHSTVDRSGLYAAQTPQGFRFKEIYTAHRRFHATPVTDDIALAELAGLAIGLVKGERANIKLTTQDDLKFMTRLAPLPETEIRVGTGFDVHAFAPHDDENPGSKRTLALCGVHIHYPYRLKGNSDADVGLHALVDAILGAIGEGDIGLHFTADDPQWAGADSSRFLIHAYHLLKQRGGEIVNLDVTIIGESPKISPYRQEMQQRIADILKINASRVNVKGCTTEKLGFLGRAEGLAAQASATVTLPRQP